MSRAHWVRIALVAILVLIALFVIRLHVAAGQVVAQGPSVQSRSAQQPRGNVESGRLSAQAWCTECHSVQLETAGTGKFAPDFTVIAQRRSARWLNAFLRAKHKLMPNFVLNRQEADDLIAYILSLKRG